MKIRVSPSGVHVFDRTTGLNILLDEVQPLPDLWSAAPRHVSIALTNACDLSCPYCYAPKFPARLPVEHVVRWLDELDTNGCLGIGFGGGEPTLHQGLVELCRYTTMRTGLAVTLTTHAHWLDDRLLNALKGNVHFMRVSMDGVGTTYESLRGRSFAALRLRLEALRAIVPFGINYVVNARTLPDLDVAIIVAAQVGAAEFLLLPEQPVHGSGGVDHRTIQSFHRWVSAYRGPVPLAVSEAGAEGLPVCNPLVKESGLRAYAHIDAAGILKRSSYDSEGVAIGTDGLLQALQRLNGPQEEIT